MRYALSGSLAALSFSLTNALAIDRDGSCAVVYQTKYVHAAEPSVVPGAGGYVQGPKDADGDVPAEEADVDTPEEGSHGDGHGYATPGASSSVVKPSGSSYGHGYATPDASSSSTVGKPSASSYHAGSGSSSKPAVSSASASAATGYGSGYSVGGSSPAVSSKDASSTGYWSSYGVPSANASSSTAGGAGYATGASYATSVSVSSSAGVSTIADPSFSSSSKTSAFSTIADPSFTTSAKASSFSTSIIVTPSGATSAISSTASPTVSSLTSAPAQPTATGGVYGPNAIPNGNFDSNSSGWLGERKDVGAQAQSGSYVLSATANKASEHIAHFTYVVGPLNFDGKYRFSFYHKILTDLPADTTCDFGVNIDGAELADVHYEANDAAKGWQYIEVSDIAIKSALNELRFNYFCLSDSFIENGGEVEFQIDTVELVEQTPTVSPTSAPAQATPSGTVYGPNRIPNGNFDSDASGWIGNRKDVGAQAQSGSYVLSLPVNAKNYRSATFDYMVGPLNWDGKYHASFYWKVATTAPADVVCQVTSGMGTASFYRGAASLASQEWQHVAVENIAINSAINDFTVDFDCGTNAFFDNGGEIEFQIDTVELFEQIPPVTTTTPSQVCSTAAPTGTPGPNIVRNSEISSPSYGWDYDYVTTVKDVGAEAHSAPYVLAITPTEGVPFGDLSVELRIPSLASKYTISFWVRFVSSNMPAGTEPTLVTEVGFQHVDRHIFSASDLEKGWMYMEFKDVKLQKYSDSLKFDFFDYGFPEILVPGGELTWWLDDVQMWEQAPEIVTCV